MDSYRRQAARLKAIAHPVRLQIVDLLVDEPECVCHLSAALGKPQPYVSQQLRILRDAGVIADERDGTNIYYRLADEDIARQVAAACGDGQTGSGSRAVPQCTCPKCTVARGGGPEAFKVAC